MASLRSVWQKLAGKSAVIKASPNLAAAQEKPSAPHMAGPVLASVSRMPKAAKDVIPDQYLPLWQLLNQRQIIEVKVEGSSLPYQTLVLAIDIQRGLLWLDDLFPSQHVLEIGDRITLRHHRNGEELSFNSAILAWGSDYGANGLAIMLPEQLCYVPRRQFNRADMSDQPSLGLKVRPIGQDISYGSVLDISSGGLRASIPGNLLGQLRHGALLPLCELSLSDELTIRCSARVRGFRLLRTPHRHTQISLEFVDLAQERVQQLQQFINNLIYLQQADDLFELRSA
jgi:c-di-GMP-binding flagellar brake protein YcgR